MGGAVRMAHDQCACTSRAVALRRRGRRPVTRGYRIYNSSQRLVTRGASAAARLTPASRVTGEFRPGTGVDDEPGLYFRPDSLDNRLDEQSPWGDGMKRIAHAWLSIVAAAAMGACSDEPSPRDSGATPAPAPADTLGNERIVYSSLRPGNWDIFYFAPGGGAPRRLT